LLLSLSLHTKTCRNKKNKKVNSRNWVRRREREYQQRGAVPSGVLPFPSSASELRNNTEWWWFLMF